VVTVVTELWHLLKEQIPAAAEWVSGPERGFQMLVTSGQVFLAEEKPPLFSPRR
jgi:hypothetical protein